MPSPIRIAARAALAGGIVLGLATAAFADPQPSIDVPAGWSQTHSGNGDTTWTRDGQQLHAKVHTFTGTLDELVRVLRNGVASDPDNAKTKVEEAAVRTCGGTLRARRVTMDIGTGPKRVVADLTVAVDGANLYEASYLRLASEPDLPEAHSAVMSLCIKPS